MNQGHSRIQEYLWLAPVLLAASVALELLTPTIVSGAALIAVAAMAAAITSSFRYTLLVVAVGIAISGVSALEGHHGYPAEIVQIVEVLIASALALALRRMLDSQSARFSLVRSTAEELQRAILPPLPTIVGPMTVACRYEAAYAEARIGVISTPWRRPLSVCGCSSPTSGARASARSPPSPSSSARSANGPSPRRI